MPATDDELAFARSYIGNVETEDEFNSRVDRIDAHVEFDTREELINAAIEESLRAQLTAYLTDGPSQASLGSISQSTSSNISGLQAILKDFQANAKGASKSGSVKKLWRQPTR